MLNKYQHKNQQTIKKKNSIKGIGLHTGVETVATFKPAEENFGIPNLGNIIWRFRILEIQNIDFGTTIWETEFVDSDV